MFDLLMNDLTAGFGAFAGGMDAYLLFFNLSRREEAQRRKREYLCLLLFAREHLESRYTTFSAALTESVREVDGVKVVVFDLRCNIS